VCYNLSMAKRFQRAVLLVHWAGPGNDSMHGYAQCGSTSIHYTGKLSYVTCPRCKARRDFRAAVAAQGNVSS